MRCRARFRCCRRRSDRCGDATAAVISHGAAMRSAAVDGCRYRAAPLPRSWLSLLVVVDFAAVVGHYRVSISGTVLSLCADCIFAADGPAITASPTGSPAAPTFIRPYTGLIMIFPRDARHGRRRDDHSARRMPRSLSSPSMISCYLILAPSTRFYSLPSGSALLRRHHAWLCKKVVDAASSSGPASARALGLQASVAR